MRLTPKTKIDGLLKTYPSLLETLPRLSPKFEKLKNPVLRRTVAKVASLSQVASLADFPLEKLLTEVAAEIRRVSGGDVEIDLTDGKEKTSLPDDVKQEILKDIIRDLHAGGDLEVLKKRFADLVKDVKAGEIAAMEQKLIEEGMPVEEVRRLCDVHVQVFQESLEEKPPAQSAPGHPLHTLAEENRALEKIIHETKKALAGIGRPPDRRKFESAKKLLSLQVTRLLEVEKHYLKKENQLFPLLESKGVSGPSQVMWSVHDTVRRDLQEFRRNLESGLASETVSSGEKVLAELSDMIYKEEKILFPMALETLNEAEWARVKGGEEELGYAWITPGSGWKPSEEAAREAVEVPAYSRPGLKIKLDTGMLSEVQLNRILKCLPVDISFVDESDTVLYYSQTADRIFPRSPGVIGRKVQNCHPPESVHIVNRILQAFRAGERDVAEFWINLKGRLIHIRYLAVRDDQGQYLGCLEVSQDVTAIRGLQGEKRLLDWE